MIKLFYLFLLFNIVLINCTITDNGPSLTPNHRAFLITADVALIEYYNPFVAQPQKICTVDGGNTKLFHCPLEKIGTYVVSENSGTGPLPDTIYYHHVPDLRRLQYDKFLFPGSTLEVEADHLEGITELNIYGPAGFYVNLDTVQNPTELHKLTAVFPNVLVTGTYSIEFVANFGEIFQGTQTFYLEIKNPSFDSVSIHDSKETKPTTVISIHGTELDAQLALDIKMGAFICSVLSRTATEIQCEINGGTVTDYNFDIKFKSRVLKSYIPIFSYRPALIHHKIEGTMDKRVVTFRMYKGLGIDPTYSFTLTDKGALNEPIVKIYRVVTVNTITYHEWELQILPRKPDITISYEIKLAILGSVSGTNLYPDIFIPLEFKEPEITEITPLLARFTPHHMVGTPITTDLRITGLDMRRHSSIRVTLVGIDPVTNAPFIHPTTALPHEVEYTPANYISPLSTDQFLTITISSIFQIHYDVKVFYELTVGDPVISNVFAKRIEFFGLQCLGRTSLTTPIKNPPVDWWFTYKIRHFAGITAQEEDGYLYSDSFYESDTVNGYQGLSDRTKAGGEYSPLAATFKQIEDYDYSYYFYNDQIGRRDNTLKRLEKDMSKHNIYGFKGTAGKTRFRGDKTFGHSKGIVIYDQTTGEGLHIIHSQPYFPYFTEASTLSTPPGPGKTVPTIFMDVNNDKWIGDRHDNQHFFCYSFGPVDLANPVNQPETGIEYVTRLIMRNNGMVYKAFDPNPIAGSPFDNINNLMDRTYYDAHISNNCKNQPGLNGNGFPGLINNCYWADSVFRTKGGKLLDSFAKLPNTYNTNAPVNQQFAFTMGGPLGNAFTAKSEGLEQEGFDLYEVMVEYFNAAIRNVGNVNRAYFAHTFQGAFHRRAQDTNLNKKLANVEVTDQTILPLTAKFVHGVQFDYSEDRSSIDHSKIFYNMNPNKNSASRYDKIFCSGDNNRHNGQFERGGGSVCVESHTLSSYFQSRVRQYTSLIGLSRGFNTIYQFNQKPSYGSTSTFFNFMMDSQITFHAYDNSFVPVRVPEGFIFEFTRSYTDDAPGLNVIEEKTVPASVVVTQTPPNEDTFVMAVYRKYTEQGQEWRDFWSFNVKAAIPPVNVYHKYAYESPNFKVYKCYYSAIAINSNCKRETADERLSNKMVNALYPAYDPFEYSNQMNTLMFLEYQIPTESNSLFTILDFIGKLHAQLPFIVNYGLVYEIYRHIPIATQQVSYVDSYTGSIFSTKPDLDCKDELIYLLTKKALVHYIHTENIDMINIDEEILVGLSLALSKFIDDPNTPNIDSCFISEPLTGNAFSLEGNLRPNDRFFSYATLFWDWLDTPNDKLFGFGVFQNANFKDKNIASVIPVLTLFKASRYATNIHNIYNNLELQYRTDRNEDIIYYNTDLPKPILRSSKRSLKLTTSNNIGDIDNYLNQMFVNTGYFTSVQFNNMISDNKFKLVDSINQWYDNSMVNVLIESPNENELSNLLLSFYNQIYLNIGENIHICKGSQNTFVKICDPMSLITFTGLFKQVVNNYQPIIYDESSSIKIYYSSFSKEIIDDQLDNTIENQTIYNGLMVFTIDGLICDATLVHQNISELNNINIFENHCLQVGPTVEQISSNIGSTNGNYEIYLSGFRFTNNLIVSIGAQDCIPTTFINSTLLSCVVPPGIGISHPISLKSPTKQILIENEVFNYNKPIIQSMNPQLLEEFSSGQQITISGENFGTSIANVDIYITDLGEDLLLDILEVTDNRIIFSVDQGYGKNHMVSLVINNELVEIQNGNQSITMFSYPYPVITSISPESEEFIVPSVLDSWLTIFGNNFGIYSSDARVYIASVECKITIFTSNIIFCKIPLSRTARVAVDILNYGTIYSPTEFKYKSPEIYFLTDPTNLIPTTGGLVQFTGKGLGTSTDTLNQTLLDDQLIDCTPHNTIIECVIPKGVNPGNLEIISKDNETSIVLQIYDKPQINYYYPDTTYTFVYGANLAPSGALLKNSSIFMVDINWEETECPITGHNDFVLSCNPFVSLDWNKSYHRIYVVVGGIKSNLLSYNFVPPYTGPPL